MTGEHDTPRGVARTRALFESRRAPLRGGEALPAADADLAPLARTRIPLPCPPPETPPRNGHARKRAELRATFAGKPEICALNALLIAHLRKRDAPPQAPLLFQRLWAEHGALLLAELDPRWLVSSLATFGDHGVNPAQRSAGLALATLFNTMKLYEFERLHSGLAPHKAFTLPGRAEAPLPLEMEPLSLRSGGLDANLAARLWAEAEHDPVLAPLAHHLLESVMLEERGIFHRLRIMRIRAERAARKAGRPWLPDAADAAEPAGADAPAFRKADRAGRVLAPVPRPRASETLRWGVVTTTAEAPGAIARFAAHHIALGADLVHVYLDAPGAGALPDGLPRHPRLKISRCDAAFWHQDAAPRPDRFEDRQLRCASRTLADAADDLDWLCHLEADEFLVSHRPVAETLAAAPPEAAWARIASLEALAVETGAPRHFKRTPGDAGQPETALTEVYPGFGDALPAGFLGPSEGRPFVRTRIPDCRLGLRGLYHGEAEIANVAPLPALQLAHLHAPSWQAVRETLGMAGATDDPQAEGDLRAFFDAVCADSPALRARLAARGMLVAHDLALDETMRAVFGVTP